jgi:hypothetical protein
MTRIQEGQIMRNKSVITKPVFRFRCGVRIPNLTKSDREIIPFRPYEFHISPELNSPGSFRHGRILANDFSDLATVYPGINNVA